MTTEEKPEEQLQLLVEAAKNARLSAAEEERAAELLKQCLAGGPKALPPALEAMILLPWSVGVKAVSDTWPDLKPTARTRLLAGLAKLEAEGAKRLRLSLARGIHALDAAPAQKLLLGVCEAMFGTEGGPSQRDRQTFANVMLGKAKPWLMNVALAELKPAEAARLIETALDTAQHAPIFTQIWILRWIADAGKFEELPPERIEGLAKSIQRWQPRWRKELRKIIPNLPPALEAVMTPEPPPAAPAPEVAPPSAPDAPRDANREDMDTVARLVELAERPDDRPAESPRRQAEPRREREREREREGRSGQAAAKNQQFDLGRALREIDNYVARLQSELQAASRRREPAPPRASNRPQPPVSNAELDELRRHNDQLAEQNEELRRQLEELATDHEDRASTLALEDGVEQFKTLLGLKLKEDFAVYQALSRESLTEVVRRHAQELLGHVFSVLEGEGVRLGE